MTDIDPETGAHSPSKHLGGYPQGKVVVAVEEVLKGSPDAFIEFTVHGTCYGIIEEGGKYIFHFDKTSNGYSNPKWSSWLPREDEFANFLSAQRTLIRGERLSTIFGTLRDNDFLGPVEGVTVVAEKNGVKFEAVTDSKGRYEFGDLPEGEYKVHPLLAPALRPAEYSGLRHAKPGDTASIRDALCGARLDFFASHNGVIRGRIEDAEGKPVYPESAILYKLDEKSKYPYKHDRFQNEPATFSFVDIPPGRYIIEVTTVRLDRPWPSFYYPGVSDEKEAVIIELVGGQEVSGLVFKLPPH